MNKAMVVMLAIVGMVAIVAMVGPAACTQADWTAGDERLDGVDGRLERIEGKIVDRYPGVVDNDIRISQVRVEDYEAPNAMDRENWLDGETVLEAEGAIGIERNSDGELAIVFDVRNVSGRLLRKVSLNCVLAKDGIQFALGTRDAVYLKEGEVWRVWMEFSAGAMGHLPDGEYDWDCYPDNVVR